MDATLTRRWLEGEGKPVRLWLERGTLPLDAELLDNIAVGWDGHQLLAWHSGEWFDVEDLDQEEVDRRAREEQTAGGIWRGWVERKMLFGGVLLMREEGRHRVVSEGLDETADSLFKVLARSERMELILAYRTPLELDLSDRALGRLLLAVDKLTPLATSWTLLVREQLAWLTMGRRTASGRLVEVLAKFMCGALGRSCKVCGCTSRWGCSGASCSWVGPDLCSCCVMEQPAQEVRGVC